MQLAWPQLSCDPGRTGCSLLALVSIDCHGGGHFGQVLLQPPFPPLGAAHQHLDSTMALTGGHAAQSHGRHLAGVQLGAPCKRGSVCSVHARLEVTRLPRLYVQHPTVLARSCSCSCSITVTPTGHLSIGGRTWPVWRSCLSTQKGHSHVPLRRWQGALPGGHLGHGRLAVCTEAGVVLPLRWLQMLHPARGHGCDTRVEAEGECTL